MVTVAVLCLAFLSWPAAPARTRLRTLTDRPLHRWRPPRPSAITLTCAAGAAGWLTAALPGAAAASLAAATAQRRWQARAARARSLNTTTALAEAVHSLVAALRAGAHPADAAESAATDAPPSAGGPMRAIAAAARLDGDMTQALSTAPPVLNRVARAWSLAQRHGLPLADVLDAVARDLDQRVRFTRQVLARMAGPRTSATVLAVLPALGIALGELMGAHPLHVLTTTPLGGALLVVGVTLLIAGITWCARLTTQAVPR